MESLYILIPIAIVFVAIAVAVFFWAVRTGQFDDLDAEAQRILFDEVEPDKNTLVDSAKPKTQANTESENSQKHD